MKKLILFLALIAVVAGLALPKASLKTESSRSVVTTVPLGASPSEVKPTQAKPALKSVAPAADPIPESIGAIAHEMERLESGVLSLERLKGLDASRLTDAEREEIAKALDRLSRLRDRQIALKLDEVVRRYEEITGEHGEKLAQLKKELGR